VHDVIGANALIIDSTSLVHRGNDVDAAVIAEGKARMAAKTREAVGDVDDARAMAYGLLLGLGSHDTSAMRELIGVPERVLYAAQRSGGRMITAAFDYGKFVCQFETGVDRIPRFEAYLQVNTPTETLRVDYDTPYIRHLPARLTTLSASEPAGFTRAEGFPTRNDSFVAEWRAFHANIVNRARPKTSIADARQDLVLFQEMVGLMS
jgi:predicted dehydrogenase